MGMIDRIFRREPAEARAATAGSPFASAFAPGPTAAGHLVTARIAENLSTVLACVGAVSSVTASLPAYVYRRDGKGRVELPDHPVSRLLRRPNGPQTWPDWVEWTVAHVLLQGNALSVIDYDGAGRPTALRPIPWGNVQPLLLANGTLAYDVVAFQAPWGGVGRSTRYLAEEVFHLRDRSDDGLLGRSRLSRAPEVLGNALALQEWSGAMWKNAATPSGALKFPSALTKPQMDALREQVSQGFTGTHNARKTLILESGAEWQAISVSPEDAEVLASRRFSVEELCRLYQVPPPIIQDYTHNTFTNAQQAALWFAQFTLGPWVRKIEAEFQRSIFTDPAMMLEIDLSGLMRGDYAARWAAHAIAVQNDILDRNEVREIEGWNPRAEKAMEPKPEPNLG
jgi:HK97 family phage portal protein